MKNFVLVALITIGVGCSSVQRGKKIDIIENEVATIGSAALLKSMTRWERDKLTAHIASTIAHIEELR